MPLTVAPCACAGAIAPTLNAAAVTAPAFTTSRRVSVSCCMIVSRFGSDARSLESDTRGPLSVLGQKCEHPATRGPAVQNARPGAVQELQ